jgi:4-diphosphocytidyl-2-C-methyl-D-erythritol kinase
MVKTSEAYALISGDTQDPVFSFKQKYRENFRDPGFYSCLKNDFEEEIFKKYPEVKDLYHSIALKNPIKVMLCGSGSSLFGLFTAKSKAEDCERSIRRRCRFSCITEFYPGSDRVLKK